MVNMTDISVLEKTGAARILLFLYNNGNIDGVNISEISKHIEAANETVASTIRRRTLFS